MSDTEFDVVIAAYLVPDLAEQDFGAALPPGSAGIVAIYDRSRTDTVDATLVSAVLKSTAEIDGDGAKHLKAALAEAQAGMGS